MLTVELYDKSSDLYKLSFIKDSGRESVIICPNPFIADTMREKIVDSNLSGSLTVLTIAKFIKDELKDGFGTVETVSKADLILRLGTIWKQYFSDYSDEIFFQSFNLFTELRGFSLSFELISEVLQEYDEVVVKAISLFWLYVDEVKLVDEQCSYAMLVDAYRQIEHPVHKTETNLVNGKNIVFWGFAHLSASQVDLLKSLAIRHDIYIPFPALVFDKTKSTDWIRWLTTEESETEDHSEAKDKINCNIVTFSKNRLGEALTRFRGNLVKEKVEKIDVFLAMKNPSMDHFDEIPFENMHYKTSVDLFQDELSNLFSKCREQLFSNERNSIEVDELLDFLKAAVHKITLLSDSQKNFKVIKAASLIAASTNQWSELSEANDQLSLFDLKMIEHVVSLKSPRNFFAPLLDDNNNGTIQGLEALDSFSDKNLTVVCASSSYSPIRGEKPSYTDEVLQVLKNIGPIKRKELEYLTIFHRLKEMLRSNNTYLFLEGDMLEHDLAWSGLLADCEMHSVELDPRKSPAKETDYLGEVVSYKTFSVSSLSATRLQSYVDCPRSYYFKYIENLSIYPHLENKLRPDQLGVLQHKVIEDYLQAYDCWQDGSHVQAARKCLDEYIVDNGMQISDLDYQSYLIEIRDYSRNGICSLLNLKEQYPEIVFRFEYSLNNRDESNVRGSVDCVAITSQGIGVLDFKRSKSSIPLRTELERFDKIQLWFYLKALQTMEKDFLFWGYLNLSDPPESLVYGKDELTVERLKITGITAEKNIIMSKRDVKEIVEEYRSFEELLVKRIEEDSTYYPVPRKNSVCTFCSVSNICPRKRV